MDTQLPESPDNLPVNDATSSPLPGPPNPPANNPMPPDNSSPNNPPSDNTPVNNPAENPPSANPPSSPSIPNSNNPNPNTQASSIIHRPSSIIHHPFIFILYAIIIIVAFIASILFFSPPSFTAKLLNTGNRLSLKLPQINIPKKSPPSITPIPSIPSINFSALMTPANLPAQAGPPSQPTGETNPTAVNQPTIQQPQPTTYSLSNLASLRVPEPNEKLDDPTIAIPNSAMSIPNSPIKTRSFEITAQKNTFVPDKIIVYKDDIVRIRFTPIDGNFDLTVSGFGVKKEAKMAETVVLEFQADTSGAFTFLCEGCGMKGDKPAVWGTLFVVPRP